jgi:hypothetical protein
VAEEPDNLVLVMLRRMDGKRDRALDEARDLKVRSTRTLGNLAGVHLRIDRSKDRVARIERRLDLVEAE